MLFGVEPAASILAAVLILVNSVAMLAIVLKKSVVLATIRPGVHAVSVHDIKGPLSNERLTISPLVVAES